MLVERVLFVCMCQNAKFSLSITNLIAYKLWFTYEVKDEFVIPSSGTAG